jgi:type IV secretion system protein VirD4
MEPVIALLRFYAKCFVFLAILIRRMISFLTYSHSSQLASARFAAPHETARLARSEFADLEHALLLGRTHFHQIAAVRPAKKRPELGNTLVCAPPRMGKSKAAIAEILAATKLSMVVLDVKGELYDATAGYRRTLGPVYVFDPRGYGNAYDPLSGKTTEDQLYAQAVRLLFEANEREPIYAQRGSEMLMCMWQAARMEGIAPFPYTRFLIRQGPKATAARLNRLSPQLATQFLLTDFEDANFSDDRFLLSCWGTITARLRPMITETVIRSLTRSEFSPEALMLSPKPVTWYFRIREQDLVALTPLQRLFWLSTIDTLTTTHDDRKGNGCNPVLLLIDEGGRVPIPNLHDATSTVCGRGVSVWLIVQSLEQLNDAYTHDRANIIRGNCDTHLFHRPNDPTTAKYLEDRLGSVSVYARSETLYHGEKSSESRSERLAPLLTKEAIGLMDDTEVIAWHRNNRPLKLSRMDWQEHPLLINRRNIPPPPVHPLPPLTDLDLREPVSSQEDEIQAVNPDDLVDPEELLKH